MHSKIFQIANKPIDRDQYISPEKYYDADGAGWFDYIGDEVKDEDERRKHIGYLAELLAGVFTLNDDLSLTYMGKEALRGFLGKWADSLRELAAGLTADNIMTDLNLFRLSRICNQTHKEACYRFDIEEWNGWAGPFNEIIGYAYSLEEGDRIYVGAIIDFHF